MLTTFPAKVYNQANARAIQRTENTLSRLGLYRIDEQIAGLGASSYRGVVEASQKPVYIHLISQDVTVEEKRQILSRLQRRLSLANGSNGLLDVRHEGAQLYAITEVIPGFTGFSDWLNQESPEAMRGPVTNTVDQFIGRFDTPQPVSDPVQFHRPKDLVAEMFAKPLAATEIRGQAELATPGGRPSYSPPVEPGPGLYTRISDPGRAAATASHAVTPSVPVTPPPAAAAPPKPDLLALRVDALERQVGMWKALTIAALALSVVCFLLTFVLLMRSK
jgi:hypothetical protein